MDNPPSHQKRDEFPQQAGTRVESIPHQLIEELGLLLPPKDIVAARATCRTWRSHLSQRVSTHPSGSLFELVACPSTEAWEQRVKSLVTVFPAVKELLVIVGGRVSGQVFDHQMCILARALPDLQRLELVYLMPPQGVHLLHGTVQMYHSGSALLPISSGISSFYALRHLRLNVNGPPTPPQIQLLPSNLQTLQLSSGHEAHGLTDATLGLLGRQLPGLVVLEADLAPYSVTAESLKLLPATLQRLELYGMLGLGRHEVQALCTAVPKLCHLTIEVSSDRHAAISDLLQRHPCQGPTPLLINLTLNQDEADYDPEWREIMQSLLDLRSHTGHDSSSAHILSDEFYAQQLATGQEIDNVWHDGPSNPPGSLSLHAVPCSSPAESDPSPSNQAASMSMLALQSIKLIPSEHANTPHFLSDICRCLPTLTSLTIAEPWVAGGQGRALTGKLTCLSHLTMLTSLTVALMPGFPVPALHLNAEVLDTLGGSCKSLRELAAVNAVEVDEECFKSLQKLTQLTKLFISPASSSNSKQRGGPPSLPLNQLPALKSLCLTGFELTNVQPEDSLHCQLSQLEDLVLVQCSFSDSVSAGDDVLRHCPGLRSLMMHQISGVDDGFLADPDIQLNHLTSLQLSVAPAFQPQSTQVSLADCSRLTALKQLMWESNQVPEELSIVRQMSQGPRCLQLLRLGPASDVNLRSQTRQMVLDLLPCCVMAG